MNIDKALTLQRGQQVHYPSDMGSPAGYASVQHVEPTIFTRGDGVPYVWVHLDAKGVWPSNRLG